MLKTMVTAVGLLGAGEAWAGCFNYEEHPDIPAPRVEICYEGKCEVTLPTYSCGNAHGAVYGYANGWHVEYSASEGDLYIPSAALCDRSKEGEDACADAREMDYSRLTCRPLDEKDECFVQ